MALFTDGNISSLSDLRDQESGVLEAAHGEGVDLTVKLRLAQEEIGIELAAFLLEHGQRQCSEAAARDLRQVAVTPALKQWHTLHTLALTYRDLYYNQYNDRYAEKWKEYSRLARVWAERLFESGVGLVANPLSRAGAPTLTSVPGVLPGGSHFVQVSWLDAWGNEGAVSEAAALVTQDYSQLVVMHAAAPANACGWNVYAGASVEAAVRQNQETLEIGASWTMPAEGLREGAAASQGQGPNIFVTIQRARRRG